MKLSQEQMTELAERFFEYEYYAIGSQFILIDGRISVDSILKAADYIRSLEKGASGQ